MKHGPAIRAAVLAESKRRAVALLERGDVKGAIGAMLTGLNEHPDLRFHAAKSTWRAQWYRERDLTAARAWIESFE